MFVYLVEHENSIVIQLHFADYTQFTLVAIIITIEASPSEVLYV